MSALQKATLEEIQQTASRICRDYLTGRWKEVSPEQLIVKRISGGLSNYLYYVSLPHKAISVVDVDIDDGDDTDQHRLPEENLLYDNDEQKLNNVINGESSSLTNTTLSTTIRTKASSSSSITHNDENSNELVCRALLGVNITNANANANASHNSNINNNHNGTCGILQHHPVNSKRKRCDSGSSAISLAQHTIEPQEVLLRIYGQSHGEDALEAMITESVVFALLSERNFGPKLHGIFPGGRIEQYIPARPLLTTELSIEIISRKIAEKMGEIHSLNIPMSKEPDWLWNCMQRWLRQLPSILITRQEQHQHQQSQEQQQQQMQQQKRDDYIEFVNNFNFLTEIQWLKSIVDRDNYPVVFCHNDLQEGNILMRQDGISLKVNKAKLNEKKETNGSHRNVLNFDYDEPDLIIIDFEYCAYNYRSFDLANHFLEWTFDYSNPQFPFFYHRNMHYPTKEQRHNFIRNYLKKFYDYDDNDDVDNNDQLQITTDDIEMIDKEVHLFSMLSHLFWSLWSVVNTTSNIEFGYWDYAITRIKEYQLLKQQFLCNNDNKVCAAAGGGSDNAS